LVRLSTLIFKTDYKNDSSNRSYNVMLKIKCVMNNESNQIAKYPDAIGLWTFLLNDADFTNSGKIVKLKS
jgi:hypothetical protein